MVVSEVGFHAQPFYTPQPRIKLNVRPAGCTGRRRLSVSIDWDKLYQLQFLYGISEYCAALILGYSLSSFYRHKKLRKDGFEKPYTLPAWVDICDIGRLQKLTGWSERKCAKHLEIPMTTYYRWREWLKDGVIPIACPGALDHHHNETPKERLQRYLHSRTFMRKRKCRNNPNPKTPSWKPVEIDWVELR